MVGNNIDHNIHSFIMSSVDEVLKVILWSELTVDLLPVSGPVSMVSSIEVIDNRGDPDGIEAHTSDVVKVILNTLEVSSAISGEILANVGRSISSGESIGQKLVNSSSFPLIGLSGHG